MMSNDQQLHTPQRKSFSRQVLPIRLIDISATIHTLNGGIHFVVPWEWSFHVISHTWSLDIRKFSEEVGQQIQLHDQYSDGQPNSSSYNWYFQQVDLRGKPAYDELKEFLSFLAEDGVTYAWFDALCINQTDDKEKSKEIANMGAYYSNSCGCYVLVHGIGQGYSLWGCQDNRAETGRLPRWFERVWTLQEFVLPSRLTFLTELPQRVQTIIKGLITKANSSIGFCRCCILKDVLRELPEGLWRERLQFLTSSGMDVKVNIDESDILHEELFPGMISPESEIPCGESACSACGMPSLIKRFQRRRHSTNSSPELYMVEREAYLFLLYLDTFFPLNCSYASMPRIFELIRSLQRVWDPWSVVSEIGTRKCTHEEDRVLGILGLLGVGGEMQVRTGESLEKQLVNLGRYCKSADPDLLVKMCLVQQAGGSEPGMSWVPSLHGATGEVCGLSLDSIGCFEHHPGGPGQCCRHLTPGEDVLPQPVDVPKARASMDDVVSKLDRLSHLKRQVEILECCSHGITLEARAAAGRVLPYVMLRPKDRAAVKEVMMQVASASPGAHSDQEESFPFQLWKGAGGVIESPADHTPTHCIYFQEAGVFLPLIVTLFSVERSTRPGYLEPALVMADAVRPWNAVHLNLGGNKGAGEALTGVSVVGGHRLEDERLTIEMEICMLSLGTVGEERSTSYDVAMVCLGRKKSDELVELHKVGLFVLPSRVGNEIFEGRNGGSRMRYVLGGFGEDLSMFARVSLMKKCTRRAIQWPFLCCPCL